MRIFLSQSMVIESIENDTLDKHNLTEKCDIKKAWAGTVHII